MGVSRTRVAEVEGVEMDKCEHGWIGRELYTYTNSVPRHNLHEGSDWTGLDREITSPKCTADLRAAVISSQPYLVLDAEKIVARYSRCYRSMEKSICFATCGSQSVSA